MKNGTIKKVFIEDKKAPRNWASFRIETDNVEVCTFWYDDIQSCKDKSVEDARAQFAAFIKSGYEITQTWTPEEGWTKS